MENKKIAFIYWFAYYSTESPSVRYRAKYPLMYLKNNHGVDSYLVVPSYSCSGIFLFLKAYFSALLFRKKDSLIVIQRVQSNFIFANLLKLLVRIRRTATVYDLDDADYLEGNPKMLISFVKHCQTVSAGSKQIASTLSKYNPRVVLSTSPIWDLKIQKMKKNPKFTIGWLGGFGGEHKQSLVELVFPAVKALDFDLKFSILGILKVVDMGFIKDYFKDCPNVEVDLPLDIDWDNEEALQRKIVQFDIGVATLTNSEMQLSKSGIKAKQYLNNGIPVLSSNLPENNSVVVDGYNGFLCSNTQEFKERLLQFSQMKHDDYMRFSKNARASIENFNHQKYFEQFEKMK